MLSFLQVFTDDSWDIVVKDVLVRRNEARSEENRRISYCLSRIAGYKPYIDMKDKQGVCYSLTRILGYEPCIMSVEWKGKGFCILFNSQRELHTRVTS